MNAYAGAVLDQLDHLFNRGTIAGLSEGRLLERYVADGDEAAFAALVARHGPMVLGVCRRVLRDERDVEDAFQATFLVLVRRAGAVRDGELVGRWLHGVAHRVAVRARAHSARRFASEQSVNEPVEPEVPNSAVGAIERRELASVVDEELMHLPSTLRAPVVLCYLEGLSHDEAARRLRWPVGTVRSRMARAREILRHRLTRRGITADGTAIMASLIRPPVPPEWLDATVRGSLNFAIYSATAAAMVASARSVAIARRVLQTMIITNLSYIGAAGLGLVLAFGGVRTLAFQGPGAARPVRIASEFVQRPAGKDEVTKTPTVAERPPQERDTDRVKEIADQVKEIDRRITEIANLEAQIESLKADLAARKEQLATMRRARAEARRQPPAGVPAPGTATTPSGAATSKKADDTVEGEKPSYINMGRTILVISPDGSRIAAYDIESGKSRPMRLPEIRGIRREVIVQAPNPYRAPDHQRPKVQMESANSPWLYALDLDRDRKVTRIAALNAEVGTWIDEAIPEPVDRSAVKLSQGCIFRIGHRLYGLSTEAKRWGVFELSPGVPENSSYSGNSHWTERDGRLFRFNPKTADWEDIYARAIEDKPAETPK